MYGVRARSTLFYFSFRSWNVLLPYQAHESLPLDPSIKYFVSHCQILTIISRLRLKDDDNDRRPLAMPPFARLIRT